MTLIDGKKTAAEIRAELREETMRFEARYGKKVGLAVVLVGEDPASQVYVRNKIRGCEEAGIRSFAHFLPADASQKAVEELVCSLAADDAVYGILVQLPLSAPPACRPYSPPRKHFRCLTCRKARKASTVTAISNWNWRKPPE